MEELTDEERLVIEKAREATVRSYAPYSHFYVGAAVLLDSGIILQGNNQENVAYPNGLCAERTALFYAGSTYPSNKVVMLAIAGRTNDGFTDEPCTPCGACRQVIVETEKRQEGFPIRILLYGKNGVVVVERGGIDLLPLQFNL